MKDFLHLLKLKLVKPQNIEFYKFLLNYEKLSDEEKIILKNNQICKLYRHAFLNSPFLNKKYSEAGLCLDSVKNVDDIKKIPFLTRQEIVDQKENILSVNKNKNIVTQTTGGTTGKPMSFYQNKSLPYESFYMYYCRDWGLNFSDNSAHLWRKPKKTTISKMINFIFWFPTIKLRFDAGIINDQVALNILSKLNLYKPKLIHGYAGSLYEFCKYLKAKSLELDYFPKAIWTTASKISNNHKRFISSTLKAPIYDEYGSKEIPWIARERKPLSNELHINNYSRHLEIVQTINNIGDVAVTDLFDFSFPKIRYLNGDKGSFHHKSTPWNPILNPIEGRSSENLIIPSIGTINASFLTTIFNEHPESINGFQFIQTDESSIKLLIIPNSNDYKWKENVSLVENKLNVLFQNKCKLEIQITERLILNNGKINYVIRNY